MESGIRHENIGAVTTCAVFKLPVCCAACGSQQYETLLRISQANSVGCVQCGRSIDLPRDNSTIFNRAIAFVEGERANRLAQLVTFRTSPNS